ncbi:myotubularin-related protein 7-like [Sinocyclocheilus grahami]|uniref:myotubularin-related protein 7-like n=1 Tax=Sinocyclocheilus grahami TaxID=75366 RepID=UPI0007AD40CB|nr:PREDICTED: myotubularin-related protein 7-like [Sinocyclocheilus grahami]
MEHITTPKVENVRMIDRLTPRKSTVGTLYLSSTHTIFVENSEARKETWVLHSLVYNVERLPTNPSGSPLIIRCKNFLVYRLLIPQEKDCLDVLASLTRLSRPERYGELFCFSFNPNLDKELREKAWGFIDLKAEFNRMGIPSNLWHVTAANHEYRVSICSNACSCSGSITMFSLPTTYFKLHSTLNAMANRAAGKGYENEDHYTNTKLQFIGIENIHVMRNSQQKLIDVGELVAPSMSDFLWGLENSGWLKHIKAVLDAGIFIAKAVAEDGVSVLVHCSDGWDRTAQKINKTAHCAPFWKGMYGRAEKSVASHQSPADCLNVVREESQQLEEELSTHQERLAQLKEKKTSGGRKKTNKLSERVRRPIPTESKPSSPLDYFTTTRSEKHTPSFTLPLELAAPPKNGDPDDLSTCSDFESGVADLSSHSSSAGDDAKDPDSDEAVKTNA